MGKESSRERVWAAIRKHKTGFTTELLTKECGVEADTLKTYLRGLKNAGFIEVCGQNDVDLPYVKTQFKRNVYRLLKDVGVDAPRVTREGRILEADLTQDIWRAMKILKQFSIEELTASTPRQISPLTVETYCRLLTCAKYLRREGKRYRLILYTGAKAPKIKRVKSVYDPNTKKIVWTSEGEE